jgi:hypothetical protein
MVVRIPSPVYIWLAQKIWDLSIQREFRIGTVSQIVEPMAFGMGLAMLAQGCFVGRKVVMV